MTGKTLLMALGVGVVVGLILGIGLVGLIGANREQAAPSTPPPPTVNGATLDTVFIHHTTPENTSGNSTYLHSPRPTATPTPSSWLRTIGTRVAAPASTTTTLSAFGTTATVVSGRYSTRTARRCPWGPTSTWPS